MEAVKEVKKMTMMMMITKKIYDEKSNKYLKKTKMKIKFKI